MDAKKEAYLKKFGKHLKKIRTEKGLSIRDIELNNDMSRAVWSKIELGQKNITIFTLQKIAICLDIEVSELFKDFKK